MNFSILKKRLGNRYVILLAKFELDILLRKYLYTMMAYLEDLDLFTFYVGTIKMLLKCINFS